MTAISLLQALDYADPDNVGGASHVAMALGKELAARRWKVKIFAGCRDKQAPYRRGDLFFCHFPSPLSQERTFWDNLNHFWRPRRVLRSHPPGRLDLVFSHQPFVTWTLRRLLERLPLIYYFHSPWAEEYRTRRSEERHRFSLQEGIRTGMERWALARARTILVASAYMRERLLAHHPARALRGKIEILPHGVDTDHFRPAGDRTAVRRSLGLPLDPPTIITTRRLEDRMGLEQLLHALDICRRTLPAVSLIIVGRGRLESALRRRTQVLGLTNHVRFWGYAENDTLPRLYSAADLFVLPTQALEGFGLVTLEALACGLPVVATPVGAIPEVLGRLAPNSLTAGCTPQALADAIRSALRRSGGNTAYRQSCRDYVSESYSWARTADRFAQAAEALLR